MGKKDRDNSTKLDSDMSVEEKIAVNPFYDSDKFTFPGLICLPGNDTAMCRNPVMHSVCSSVVLTSSQDHMN